MGLELTGLPNEIWRHVFTYDSTYHDVFKTVLQEMRSRAVRTFDLDGMYYWQDWPSELDLLDTESRVYGYWPCGQST